MAFELERACDLAPADVRARLGALGEYLSNKYGLSVSWTSDNEAKISGKYLVVTIDGTLSVSARAPCASPGRTPGMLWRGKAKDYLGGKLDRYLAPSTPLDALPRR